MIPLHILQVFRGRDVSLLYSQLKIFFPDVASESAGWCQSACAGIEKTLCWA